mgnify:CR=1 FL=1
MHKGIGLALIVGVMSLTGCKKQVPTDIVQKSLRSALRFHAPATTAGMCGANVKGLLNATVTNVKRATDGSSGTAHISGAPRATPGAPPVCDGDVEFKYSYTKRTTGPRQRKTTTTTWFLDHIKLTAVQTKGVTFKAVDENATDGDDDDDNNNK